VHATWSPDVARVTTVSADGAARLWPVSIAAMLALAETRTTRPLTAAERERYTDGPTLEDYVT
jgi:hypothetical protein